MCSHIARSIRTKSQSPSLWVHLRRRSHPIPAAPGRRVTEGTYQDEDRHGRSWVEPERVPFNKTQFIADPMGGESLRSGTLA